MIYSNDDKMFELRSRYTYKCKCSHTFTIFPMEHKEYKICNYCKRRVYTDPEKQAEWDKRDEFKRKMKGLLK